MYEVMKIVLLIIFILQILSGASNMLFFKYNEGARSVLHTYIHIYRALFLNGRDNLQRHFENISGIAIKLYLNVLNKCNAQLHK